MLPNPKYQNLDLEFWANTKLLNQRLGYTRRKSKVYPNGGFIVPKVEDIQRVFFAEGLNSSKIIQGENFTEFGQLIVDYMTYRGNILINHVQHNLMNKEQAKSLFYQIKNTYEPKCPLPYNKQKGDKKITLS